jgi:UDP-glucose 4-epimerase
MGAEVTGIDDLSGGFLRNVPPDATFVQGSVTDPHLVTDVWNHYGPFDYVYHLAAYAAEGLSHFIRRFNYHNNVIGSENVINECIKRNAKCLVFTSSIAVYGANQLPMNEDLTPAPEDPYGIAKYAVELDLAAAWRVFGLNYIVFRPHNVYGERQNIGDPYRNVVGIFMNQAMKGKPLTVFGDGKQTRAFSYIDDVAPVIARAPLNPRVHNQVFNVGADKPYSILEIAEEVSRAFNVSLQIQHHAPRKEVRDAYSDHARARSAFDLGEPTPLRAGIERMAGWAKNVGPITGSYFSEIEVERGLPDSWRPLYKSAHASEHSPDDV